MGDGSIGTPALWGGFLAFVVAMLALDLGVFHRKAHAVRMREALAWSAVWIALALAFDAGVWKLHGARLGKEFLAAYLTEKALSVDNLFVFIVLFQYFAVAAEHQHRVLFWGILGALVTRAVFILGAMEILETWHWVLAVFGVFLVFTGFKILVQKEEQVEPERNPVLRLFRRFVPLADGYRGAAFVAREGGRWVATPLLMVLAVVEATDVVFAIDSVPAVIALSKDRFIVFTSNIFAVLGLRALFFVLAGSMVQFRYLKHGLGLILVFIGGKMCAEMFHVEVGIDVSLGVIGGLLAASILASLARSRRAS